MFQDMRKSSELIGQKRRLADIDRAKGFTIVLVVLGHLATGPARLEVEWYFLLKGLIYQFHMPFFMWISGFVAAYTYPGIKTLHDYVAYVKVRASRLLPGLLLVYILVVIGKALFQELVFVDNPIVNCWDLLKPFYQPRMSIVGFLWFAYVLLELYILFPILMVLFRSNVLLIVAVVFAVTFVPSTYLFEIDMVFQYLFFFFLGVLSHSYMSVYEPFLRRYGLMTTLIFVAVLAYYFIEPLPKILVGTLSVPAIHYAVRYGPLSSSLLLATLGRYVFPIYLFSMMFVGVVKGLIFSFCNLGYDEFWLVAPVLLAVGVIGPVLLKKYVLTRYPRLDRWTG